MEQQVPLRIAIFASGGGSNARTILTHFADSHQLQVSLLLSNNPASGVFEMGPAHKVPVLYLPTKAHKNGPYLKAVLEAHKIDLVVLAGYLKHIPHEVVQGFKDRILNIHPSLLPKFGGRGMFGMHVHEAVLKAGESHSGMTIHLVNEVYDEGRVLFQDQVAIQADWDAKALQKAVLKLEHHHFPRVIETYARKLSKLKP